MGVSRVDFGEDTLIDLTKDTVTPHSLLSGYSAHNKAGELIEGLVVIPTKVSELENDSKFITETGDSSKTTVTFEQAAERENVHPGDDLETAFAKLSKYCADLKQVAFSGKYIDLEGRITLTNNLLATTPGTALDAVQGKVLNGKTSKIYLQTTVNSLAPTERFLKEGDDLNAYISAGTYYANGGGITETLINKPGGLSGGFRLDIIETAGVGWFVQRIMDHNFPPNVFLRSKEGEYGLSNWVKLATNEHIDKMVKYGTWLPSNGYDPLTKNSAISIYSVNPETVPKQGLPDKYSKYGTVIVYGNTAYKTMFYVSVFGEFAIYDAKSEPKKWVLYKNNVVLCENDDHNIKLGYDNNGAYLVVDGTLKKYIQYKS